jgi:uncharacterized protein YceK
MIMIKKEMVLVATAAILVLSGCGEDRSHPKGVDADGNPIVYKNPTAIIDLNNTTHTYVPALDQYTVGGGARTTLDDPFIFSGAKSHDNDENNQSITGYDWQIVHSFSAACVDVNTTGDSAVFKFLHTISSEADYNVTCRDEAVNNGEINATLTVTDNEGKQASTTKVVKTN